MAKVEGAFILYKREKKRESILNVGFLSRVMQLQTVDDDDGGQPGRGKKQNKQGTSSTQYGGTTRWHRSKKSRVPYNLISRTVEGEREDEDHAFQLNQKGLASFCGATQRSSTRATQHHHLLTFVLTSKRKRRPTVGSCLVSKYIYRIQRTQVEKYHTCPHLLYKHVNNIQKTNSIFIFRYIEHKNVCFSVVPFTNTILLGQSRKANRGTGPRRGIPKAI